MGTVRVVTDSTADLPAELVTQLGITVVPLNVHFGALTYRDGVDLTPDRFYEKLSTAPDLPKTSQPSVGTFEEAYERLSSETDSIVSVHISAKLSGTLNSALVARESLRGRCQIEVVDTLSASLGVGMIAVSCARLGQQGASLREVADLARRMAPNVHVLFSLETLEFLQRGGRIGRAQALMGSLLSIKPLLKLEEGEIHPVEKVRTRARAIDRLVEFVELFPHVDQLAILHGHALAEAETIRKRLDHILPRERILLGEVGPVIGTHTGPGVLGVVAHQPLPDDGRNPVL